MIRVSSILIAIAGSTAMADDPAALDEAKRVELVAQWRKQYDAKKDSLDKRLAEAKVLIANKDTAALGKNRLAVTEKEIAELKKDPLSVMPTNIRAGTKAEALGRLPATSAVVVSSSDDGTLIDMAYISNELLSKGGVNVVTAKKPVTARFLVTPKIANAKPTTTVNLSGLYYVSEVRTINGEMVPVIHPVQVKKSELPK